MQPTLVLSASHPGILYINGQFAGEISEGLPLVRPVGICGPLYLDYHPFTDTYCFLTRKLVFSGGTPLHESTEEANGLNIILWPGNVVEIEVSPERRSSPPQHFQLNGHRFTLDQENLQLKCNDRPLCTLPDGAEPPELLSTASGAIFIGNCTNGKYLLCTDSVFQTQTGFLRASQLEIDSNGLIFALTASPDLVGHAVRETWKLTPEGLMLLSSEPAWTNGMPRWPKTPEETARAAIEASLAGLDAEAESYLSPALRSRMPLANIQDKCDLCIEMKYAPPGSRACVGLLQLEGSHTGRVSPLYFHASPSNNLQYPYQIDEFEFT